MGMAAHFCSSHPSQLDLSGRRRLLFSSPLQGGRQAVDNFGCRRSCSHCISVYCLRVMLKINSQQQHQQKALTDCLMCWHSYKLLDKKSNTHPLFSSPYTPKLLQRRNMKRVWGSGCHPAGDHCWLWGLMASGLRRTCSPVLRANKVVSFLLASVTTGHRGCFSFKSTSLSGKPQAPGWEVGWSCLHISSAAKVASRESRFHKTQRIHLPFPFKTTPSL